MSPGSKKDITVTKRTNGAGEQPMLTESFIEVQIGEYLRQAYEDTVSEPIPQELLDILDGLE